MVFRDCMRHIVIELNPTLLACYYCLTASVISFVLPVPKPMTHLSKRPSLTDGQAAAGQAARPGSPGGGRQSGEDPGDQAGVCAAKPPLLTVKPHSQLLALTAVNRQFEESVFETCPEDVVSVGVFSVSRIIKNKEALSEIMQDFKFDCEEGD